MRIEHKWHQERQAAVRAPKYVPIDQCKAAVDLASHNATGFTIQMVQEQMLLMLHEEFGFGRERCMRALEALQIRLAERTLLRIKQTIKELETVDVEPVVRCRDCAVPHNRRTGCPVLGGKI